MLLQELIADIVEAFQFCGIFVAAGVTLSYCTWLLKYLLKNGL